MKLQRESKQPGTGCGKLSQVAQVAQTRNMSIGKYRHWWICMGGKPIVSVTYKNERISIKNSLPYIKWVLRLSCVQVCGPIYGRLWVEVLMVFSLYVRFTKVGDFSKVARQIHQRKTAVNSLQRLQSPPNSAEVTHKSSAFHSWSFFKTHLEHE